MSDADNGRLHAFVSGSVQGVGFRAYVQRQARRLGLTGYVRNLPDGQVEVVAEGPKDALNQLLGALRIGPYGATVDKVVSNWLPATNEFHAFGIRY